MEPSLGERRIRGWTANTNIAGHAFIVHEGHNHVLCWAEIEKTFCCHDFEVAVYWTGSIDGASLSSYYLLLPTTLICG